MNIYGKENQIKAIQKYAEIKRAAAALYPVITKVFRDFDGKVYNCRLEKALQAAAPENRIYCNKRLSWIECYLWIDGEQITLSQIRIEQLKDNKRIDAAAFIESAQNKRADFLRDAAELDRVALEYDSIKEQIQSLKKALNAIYDGMPYRARDIMNLNRTW